MFLRAVHLSYQTFGFTGCNCNDAEVFPLTFLGIRQDFMDPTTGYVNASNAAGQPLFAHHIPPPFMHQTPPHGMGYIPSGSIRHPGIQHPVFIQQHPHQGPMMVPLTHGYPDNTIYYGMYNWE